VDAILLDALGTLVKLRAPAPALRAELEQRHGIRLAPADAERALAAEIAYYRAHLQEGRDPDSVTALRERCAAELRAALPSTPALRALSPAEMTATLLAALRFEAFPDAAPALRAMRGHGLTLVVVSNWDASLPQTLANVGLAPLLDGVITSAAAGVRKPDAGIFENALKLAGTAPDQALHVGDSLVEDVEGAREVGLRAVLIRRGGEPGPPGVETIASLSELSELIGST
jgi:putative hydrolase of the HAD superfamily